MEYVGQKLFDPPYSSINNLTDTTKGQEISEDFFSGLQILLEANEIFYTLNCTSLRKWSNHRNKSTLSH